MQQDSVLGNGGQPRTLHRYAYAFNNPVNYTDPSGRMPAQGGTAMPMSGGGSGFSGASGGSNGAVMGDGNSSQTSMPGVQKSGPSDWSQLPCKLVNFLRTGLLSVLSNLTTFINKSVKIWAGFVEGVYELMQNFPIAGTLVVAGLTVFAMVITIMLALPALGISFAAIAIGGALVGFGLNLAHQSFIEKGPINPDELFAWTIGGALFAITGYFLVQAALGFALSTALSEASATALISGLAGANMNVGVAWYFDPDTYTSEELARDFMAGMYFGYLGGADLSGNNFIYKLFRSGWLNFAEGLVSRSINQAFDIEGGSVFYDFQESKQKYSAVDIGIDLTLGILMGGIDIGIEIAGNSYSNLL